MVQYKIEHGTTGKFYDILTVEDDGNMTLEVHCRDKKLSYDVKLDEKDNVVGSGFVYPPLSNKRWKKIQLDNDEV